MLSLVRPLLTVARRVLKIHGAMITKPVGHKRLIAGHALELTAVAAQAAELHMLCDVAGVAGAAILVYHVLVTPEG